MPRRTIFILILTVVVCYACYRRAERNVYVRYFAQALQEIDDNYIEAIDDQKLFEGAITGMVGELDRYSGFIRQQQAGDFQRMVLDQKFGGIGIEVTYDKESKQFKVMTPIVGTPAYEAGIRAGDRIVAVDGQDTRELSTKKEVDQAIEMLRGEPGQPVDLEVIHEGQTKPQRYALVRRVIHVDSVLGDTRNPDDSWNFFLPGHDKIGYVRITSFGERTVDELKGALAVLAEHDARGLIIDLRNDPGGLLKAAIGVCELFLNRGDAIVSTRGRNPNVKKEEFTADVNGPYRKLPLVVLVNRESASASEIVAAALQDHGRALIAGERTFGKGTVQNVIPIEAGKSVLKLTIATYWRPSGKNIHRLESSKKTDDWGVSPNPQCEVKLSNEDFAKWEERRRDRDVIRPKSSGPVQEPDKNSKESREDATTHVPTDSTAGSATAEPDASARDATDPSDVAPANTSDVKAGDASVDKGDDPQLQKAVECLEHEIAAQAEHQDGAAAMD
jgi:carboxyl-terminal processing protease